jgi:GT2 family glycosyltransferase
MDLSIIIVNWNTRDLLRDCLRSIEAKPSRLAIQTIVVDNNSADDSREMVAREHPGVELMNSGGNLGFARANNLALPRVRSPLVLFLNPDTLVTAEALERMVACLESDPAIGAVGCRIVDAEGRVQQLGLQWFPSPFTELLKYLAVSERTYRRLPGFPWHDPDVSGPVRKLFGACLLVRQSVLQQVGSFDELFFMYCEDVDLCHRIARAGWKLYYLSEAEIVHVGAASSSKAPGAFSVLMGCESFSKFMRKHHGILGGAAYRCVALLGAHARLVLLLFLRALAACRPQRRPRLDLPGATRKYWTVIRWALGLQKPVIRP